MNQKFDFLNFLIENGFKTAEPNKENFTHYIDNGNCFIGFKYLPKNKFQFSTPKPDTFISSENPKDEIKAKEILNKVLKFPNW